MFGHSDQILSVSNKWTTIFGCLSVGNWQYAWQTPRTSHWNVCQELNTFGATISTDRTIECKRENLSVMQTEYGCHRQMLNGYRFEVDSFDRCARVSEMTTVRLVWTNKIISADDSSSKRIAYPRALCRRRFSFKNVNTRASSTGQMTGRTWMKQNGINFWNSIAKWHRTGHLRFIFAAYTIRYCSAHSVEASNIMHKPNAIFSFSTSILQPQNSLKLYTHGDPCEERKKKVLLLTRLT